MQDNGSDELSEQDENGNMSEQDMNRTNSRDNERDEGDTVC